MRMIVMMMVIVMKMMENDQNEDDEAEDDEDNDDDSDDDDSDDALFLPHCVLKAPIVHTQMSRYIHIYLHTYKNLKNETIMRSLFFENYVL